MNIKKTDCLSYKSPNRPECICIHINAIPSIVLFHQLMAISLNYTKVLEQFIDRLVKAQCCDSAKFETHQNNSHLFDAYPTFKDILLESTSKKNSLLSKYSILC